MPNGILVSEFALTFGVWAGFDVRFGSEADISKGQRWHPLRAKTGNAIRRGLRCLLPQNFVWQCHQDAVLTNRTGNGQPSGL
jgi:hypothetical protein